MRVYIPTQTIPTNGDSHLEYSHLRRLHLGIVRVEVIQVGIKKSYKKS